MNNVNNTGQGRAYIYGPSLLFIAVIAGLAAFLVYLPSLGNGFVTWDDTNYVVGNEHIRSMGAEFFKWAFTSTVSANYHPLTMISLALEYSVFGLNPLGYHLGNALWHALDTALVALLAVRLHGPLSEAPARKKALTVGLVTALLFAVHPLHVESVAWVSERKDVLSTFFFLLALLAYLRYTRGGNQKIYYGLTLLAFILSLLSKPMAVTLPVVLLIMDYYPLKRFSRGWGRLITEKIPFFAFSLAVAIITLMTQQEGGAVQALDSYSNIDRIVIPIRAYAFYLYKLLAPTGLSPIYPMPIDARFFTGPTLISLAVLGAITAFVIIRTRQAKPLYLAVWAFYLLTLLPVIGIIKVGGQAAGDRYTYIPTLGLLFLVGLLVASVWNNSHAPVTRLAVFCLTGLILLALSFQTVRQVGVWKNPLTFWSHIIKSYPEGVPIAYHKRGVAYAKAGAFRLAEDDFTLAIKLQSGKSFPYYNRAKVRASQGNLSGAIADLTELLAIDPGYTRVYFERGLLYEKIGQYHLALKDIKKALQLQPDLAEAYIILARLYGRLGETELERQSREKADSFFYRGN